LEKLTWATNPPISRQVNTICPDTPHSTRGLLATNPQHVAYLKKVRLALLLQ
jgi:hypothetical protein